MNIKKAIFKVYFFDTGLLISKFDETTIIELVTGNLGVFTAMILQKKQKANYYYQSSQTHEIDFVIYYNGEISVLEVKSGKILNLNHLIPSLTNIIQNMLLDFHKKYQSKSRKYFLLSFIYF